MDGTAVRGAYFYNAELVSELTASIPVGPSLTVQADAEEADINVILDRFGITGELPQNVRPPTFQDFGDQVFDFRSAVEAIEMATDAFLSMPAKVRSRFDNDPQKFVEFCSDEKNLEEMRSLGLAVPKAPEKPAEPAAAAKPSA